MTLALTDKPTKVDQTPKPKGRKNWLPNVLEFTVVLVLALLCLEPILTLAGAADDQIQDLDPITGWAPMVNHSFAWRKEWHCRSHFNSMGLRGPERNFVKPPHTLRVAVLGCSLTEALQVPYEKTYCNVLEQRLNNASPDKEKVQVLDFGVSGYGLAQEYLRLTNYALKFHPNLVIIAIRPPVLKARDMIGPAPEFSVAADGQLVLDRSKQTAWRKSPMGQLAANASWLRRNSRLWGVLGICVEQISWSIDGINIGLSQLEGLANKFTKSHLLHSAPEQSDTADNGKLLCALIKASDHACTDNNCRFMLLNLPDLRKKGDPRESAIVNDCVSDLSLNYLDLNPAFQEIGKHPHQPWLYVAHFTEPGHRIIGEQLSAFIQQKKLLNLGDRHAD
ncbi:MAG TPA: SGNH/GDSL hydrolase family protein [Trichormus sp.]|jgi:hypothetical protein